MAVERRRADDQCAQQRAASLRFDPERTPNGRPRQLTRCVRLGLRPTCRESYEFFY